MGFKAADERAEEAAREAIPIPTITAEMQQDMSEAAVPVDDNVDEEPMLSGTGIILTCLWELVTLVWMISS